MKRRVKRSGLTSVQLRPQIESMMEKFLKQGISKSQMINEALRQYLVEKEFNEIREQLAPYGRSKGIYTDEDAEKFLK